MRIIAGMVVATLWFAVFSMVARAENLPALAFGSCLRQWNDQPVWEGVASLEPGAFILMGDNVYSDAGKYRWRSEPERIAEAYAELAEVPEYQAFLAKAEASGTQRLATWDDHDYGRNDGGADYPHKLAAKRAFVDFFGVEPVTPMDEPGVYHSRYLDWAGLRVQVLLLDTRSFRSPLKRNSRTLSCPRVNFGDNTEPGATILGEAQWLWLEEELRRPADLRLLVSSIQVLPTEHCFEKWSNFPEERRRLLSLIKDTGAEGVVILSGDMHMAEISVLPANAVGYPLFEITSSGLNSARGPLMNILAERNRLRFGDIVTIDNFGSIQALPLPSGLALALQVRDVAGKVVLQRDLPLAALRRPLPGPPPQAGEGK